MKTRYKKTLWIVGVVLITGILAYLVFIVILVNSSGFGSAKNEESKLKFDMGSWVNFETKRDENVRHYMIADLEKNYLKKGMDSVKVIKLLGEPERQFGFSYDLGFYESGFDHSFLIIEFDTKGKLVNASVQTI